MAGAETVLLQGAGAAAGIALTPVPSPGCRERGACGDARQERKVSLTFVVPWRESGRWVWEHLPADGRYVGRLLPAAPAAEPGTFLDKLVRLLSPYLREFACLAVAGPPDVAAGDVLFCWELRTALAVGALRRLRPAWRRARFVAVGPILKGPVRRALPAVRWLVGDADRIVCFSRAECERQARLLGLPRERFVFVPSPWEATSDALSEEDGGYVLAVGHSGRDYPALLKAVRGTEWPVVIAAKSPRDLGRGPLPENVAVRYRTESAETDALVAGGRLVVLPLRADVDYSAGQSVLLRAMTAGKAAIVTDAPGIRDYVRAGETAVLVPAGDAGALRAAIARLWDDGEERRRLGRAARAAAREGFGMARFAARMCGVAGELCGHGGPHCPPIEMAAIENRRPPARTRRGGNR